jgi:hypothetical protein
VSSIYPDSPPAVFDDLIPPSLEAFLGATRVRRSWPDVHALIKSTLVGHLHLLVIHQARTSLTSDFSAVGPWKLSTSDRFSSPGASRTDLVEKLAATLGGSHALADVSLVVIEARTDLTLMRPQSLEIEGLGTVEGTPQTERMRGYIEHVTLTLGAFRGLPAGGRRSHRRHLLMVLDELRFGAIPRPPWPYSLTVLPIEARATNRRPEVIEEEALKDRPTFTASAGSE